MGGISFNQFLSVANNQSIDDDAQIYFVDKKKTEISDGHQIVNSNGEKRTFKVPKDVKLAQDSIYMRYQLLKAVREKLGAGNAGEVSADEMEEFEKKLLGWDDKSKQFKAEKASTPLSKREIADILSKSEKAVATKAASNETLNQVKDSGDVGKKGDVKLNAEKPVGEAKAKKTVSDALDKLTPSNVNLDKLLAALNDKIIKRIMPQLGKMTNQLQNVYNLYSTKNDVEADWKTVVKVFTGDNAKTARACGCTKSAEDLKDFFKRTKEKHEALFGNLEQNLSDNKKAEFHKVCGMELFQELKNATKSECKRLNEVLTAKFPALRISISSEKKNAAVEGSHTLVNYVIKGAKGQGADVVLRGIKNLLIDFAAGDDYFPYEDLGCVKPEVEQYAELVEQFVDMVLGDSKVTESSDKVAGNSDKVAKGSDKIQSAPSEMPEVTSNRTMTLMRGSLKAIRDLNSTKAENDKDYSTLTLRIYSEASEFVSFFVEDEKQKKAFYDVMRAYRAPGKDAKKTITDKRFRDDILTLLDNFVNSYRSKLENSVKAVKVLKGLVWSTFTPEKVHEASRKAIKNLLPELEMYTRQAAYLAAFKPTGKISKNDYDSLYKALKMAEGNVASRAKFGLSSKTPEELLSSADLYAGKGEYEKAFDLLYNFVSTDVSNRRTSFLKECMARYPKAMGSLTATNAQGVQAAANSTSVPDILLDLEKMIEDDMDGRFPHARFGSVKPEVNQIELLNDLVDTLTSAT